PIFRHEATHVTRSVDKRENADVTASVKMQRQLSGFLSDAFEACIPSVPSRMRTAGDILGSRGQREPSVGDHHERGLKLIARVRRALSLNGDDPLAVAFFDGKRPGARFDTGSSLSGGVL